MNELITINDHQIALKEYKDQRVLTFADIDTVHERVEGTAGRNFREIRKHLKEGEDYFALTYEQVRATNFVERPNSQGLTLITQSGYLMLVKSLTDDLAWKVQRMLVNTYFNARDAAANLDALSPQLQVLINLEMRQKNNEKAIEAVNQRLDDTRDIIALNPNSWRSEARSLIVKIARQLGGDEYIRDVQAQIFSLVNERAGVSLDTRLTNKRRRMAEEGVCKSKRDKLNKVDVIADDKKLIEIYIAVVKEYAIKQGVTLEKDAS